MPRVSRFDAKHPKAVSAKARVLDMIDMIPPEDLVRLIKEKPSLRGMVLGNLAELLFERHVPMRYPRIKESDIIGHDDHDRSANKSDRTITYADRVYTVQIKSIQTNKIRYDLNSGQLVACVQNDGSDKRLVLFDDESSLETVCYLRGQYDILAVPLFPFTQTDDFAYKRNRDCQPSKGRGYSEYQRQQLLATSEDISWPLSSDWETDLMKMLTSSAGSPIGRPDVIAEPGGKIRVRKTGAVIVPDKD